MSTEPASAVFARAHTAIDAGEHAALDQLLEGHPGLVREHGANGNDLLGMATAAGDERLVRLLLEAGADPNGHNVHGWTALHQAAYAGRLDLARVLLAAGARADLSARGDGGTPLVGALFWGHPVPDAIVEEVGLHPGNLRVAAGLGRANLIGDLVGQDGELTPAAGGHRAFYRPHSGFPAWEPSDDAQEVLDEAVAWAARSDRADAISLLVERGASVGADVYRGTPLAWAGACGRVDAIRRLLELGADPDARSTFGGPDHGEDVTALHLAAQSGHLEAIRVLLAAGADTAIRDGRHDGTPAHWAAHGNQPEARRLLDAG